ncbi:hypothetical protein AXK11_05070 [Cephaloticoccus primus]|uniref:Outer membrane lipoprotein BamD-like domain-containing protein n=1 Tax=Cephaloticoccus primus TaxID=1548207 RepID=A0A139SMS7_9BACT|nr:outer membrane protein assembly factor BamD [Cephaloticoccus primus]KXU35903.1 hypothetical protein AXK11_05070 [Cephaloticoccus primus]
MIFSAPRRRLPLLIAALAVLALASPFKRDARAVNLTWDPDTGWQTASGAPPGLSSLDDRRSALSLMNSARRAEERGSKGAAAKRYARVVKRYPTSIYTPEALYRGADLYLQRKQYNKAFDAYSQLIARYPNTDRFNEIIGRQYQIASALLDGARNRWWGFFPGFTDRGKGVQQFEVVVWEAPYSDYAPLAMMNIARGHQRLGNEMEAIDAYDRMINNYPDSLLGPDAYLRLAEAHASLVDGPEYDQASTQEAATYFEDFLILFPGDPGVARAEEGLDEMRTVLAQSKIKIADFYFKKRDNYTAARVFYNEAITIYPNSDIAEHARAQLAKVDAAAAKHQPSDNDGAGSAGGAKKKKRFLFF